MPPPPRRRSRPQAESAGTTRNQPKRRRLRSRDRPSLPAEGADRERYRRWLLEVSRALVEAQREIRILKALHWPDTVAQRFFARGARELPEVTLPALGFDPKRKIEELRRFERLLDADDPLQRILLDTALQYIEVVRMLRARGTPRFHEIASRLYGHPGQPFAGQTVTNLDLARHMDRLLGPAPVDGLRPVKRRQHSAEAAAALLERRFTRAFPGERVRVEVSANLTADAAAGASRLRVKRGHVFPRDVVNYLYQHEGWVHIATTLNGRRQRWLPILGKASPRSTRENEGLAVFAEWASHTLTTDRIRKLVDRVLAIHLAEQGADFLQVYRALLERGRTPRRAFDIARRVFRGADFRGGAPFTKDASYLGDFLRVFNFVRVAAKRRRLDLLDVLFAGKVVIEDVPVLSRRILVGDVAPPRYRPPWVRDKGWLASHMALSSFLNVIDLKKVETTYEDLFRRCAPPPSRGRRG